MGAPLGIDYVVECLCPTQPVSTTSFADSQFAFFLVLPEKEWVARTTDEDIIVRG